MHLSRNGGVIRSLIFWGVILVVTPTAKAAQWLSLPELITTSPDGWHIQFEIDEPSDVEIAIIDTSESKVVRHLAAGLLGANPPPPLIANSMFQDVVWDGLDDYGSVIVDTASLSARVRVGTSVAIDNIVGGDPYGWYSSQNGFSDHHAWSMNQAIDVKPDGSVFIYGNTGPLGSPMIRQYDSTGVYQKTIFPFPAGLPAAAVAEWGIRMKSDGTYAPLFSSFKWQPTMGNSPVADSNRAHIGTFIATPNTNDTLLVMSAQAKGDGPLLVQSINADGTLGKDSNRGRLISYPDLPKDGSQIAGNFFSAWSSDGTYLYVSSLYDSIDYADAENFYHDGQIFQIDMRTGVATSFYDQGLVVSTNAGVNRDKGFSQLHGLAVDSSGNVFVCDRMNGQIVILSAAGELIRTVPVDTPDDIAVSSAGVMYVTSRETETIRGDIFLHKFDDWAVDDSPSDTKYISRIISVPSNTDVQVAENNGDPRIWVTYPSAPVQIFSDGPGGLFLERDFNQLNLQKNLAINSVHVDSTTETLYVTDAFHSVFAVRDWNNPKFEVSLAGADIRLTAGSVAIDERNRYLYARGGTSRGPIERWSLDVDSSGYHVAIPNAYGTQAVTDTLYYGWFIRSGHTDMGFDISPDGSLAVAGGMSSQADLDLIYFNRDETSSPWMPLIITPSAATGAKTDLQGNIYVSIYDGPPSSIPEGYEADPFYRTSRTNALVSRIYKYAPTGSIESGNLFPFPPSDAAKIYDVAYGMTSKRQPSSFGVDGFGRIAYPTAISQDVTLIDNEGNQILRFGTYGNPDSTAGLPGELVPTSDIPLAYGHTVDISDDYVYVGDLSNNRVLRLAMRHKLEAAVPITPWEPVNVEPSARISSDVLTGSAPLLVNFDGTMSDDPYGAIVSYSWDFGDGRSGSGANDHNTFADPGSYTVTLTITDDDGASASATTVITVSEPDPNQLPAAYILATPETGPAPLEVSLDATLSEDPDGTIIDYQWNFGDSSATGARTHFTFSEVGVYPVILTITDDADATAESIVEITVLEPIENQVPIPNIVAEPVSGVAPLLVNFDAAASSDPDGDIVSYDWDFGVDTGRGVASSYTFSDPGSYFVLLTVTDNLGESATVSVGVAVSAAVNELPVASAVVTPTSGLVPLVVSFDASASADPDGEISSLVWDYGDGGGGSGAISSHTYAASGNYIAKLTVTDDKGESSSTSVEVMVSELAVNQLPIASGVVTPTSGLAPLSVNFDASTSTDSDGSIISHVWDYGDGSGGAGIVSSHTYAMIGEYTATLTVTDDGGGSATTSVSIIVGEPMANLAPVPKIAASSLSGSAPLLLEFSAVESSDSDGSIISYEWDFGSASADGVVASFTFIDPGNYTVLLTVTDDRGMPASTSVEVIVSEAVVNQLPVANAAATPVAGAAPLYVDFDAAASIDTDGFIASFLWDFGDGSGADEMISSHTYTTSGDYMVTLTVTDDAGASASTTFTINVTDAVVNQIPTASAVATPISGVSPLLVDFSAAASNDTDGVIVSYDWDFGPDLGSGETANYTFTESGFYPVTLVVTDDLGGSDSATIGITVTDPLSNEFPVAVIDAAPLSGTAPLLVDFSGTSSSDADGTIVSYLWNFDSDTASGESVSHIFTEPGTYSASLTVTDDAGASDFSEMTVTVDSAAGGPVTVVLQEGLDDYVGTLDTQILYKDQNGNKGGDSRLATYQNGSTRSLVSFDFASTIPADAIIVSAKLMLYCFEYKFLRTEYAVSVHPLNRSWVEGTARKRKDSVDGATWNEYASFDGLETDENNWITPGGDYDPTPAATVAAGLGSEKWLEWDVENLVNDWVSGRIANYGMLIRNHVRSGLKLSFYSSEYEIQELRPKLEITYIPVASSE